MVNAFQRRASLPEYFRKRIRFDHTCWRWTGALNSEGYGRLRADGKQSKAAHRKVYELLVGPIPEGLTLDHLCRNRYCVNPDHLDPVTLKENLARGFGVGALNTAKEACKRGHPFTEDNIMLWRGKRWCRACGRMRQKVYLERKEKFKYVREPELAFEGTRESTPDFIGVK